MEAVVEEKEIDGITDERWSYAQLLELSSRVAAGLQKLGFKPGQLAGLHCDATPNIVFAFYGTVLAGGSMVFAKSSLTERELTYQFGDSRPSLVFCDEANADKTKSACATISSVEGPMTGHGRWPVTNRSSPRSRHPRYAVREVTYLKPQTSNHKRG
ncbi:hypothetical protein HPB47_014597 [Ixodes persulcatus]|uniref:Uncharacterized protein n=1 Tax=Ixodes persulcatus TaxID=34615 RepID=A0AC60R0M9_IXOPE|nr:hypothetical protein HPB47_014597 [Ixodes persulcatus]